MPVLFEEVDVFLLYVIIGLAQNSADTGGRDEDVIRCGEQFVKRNTGNVIEVVVGAIEALSDQLIQLQKPVVVPRDQNTMVIVPDLFR